MSKHLRERVLVVTNLSANEEVVAEKFGALVSVMLPTVINRFTQKD